MLLDDSSCKHSSHVHLKRACKSALLINSHVLKAPVPNANRHHALKDALRRNGV